MNWLVLSSVGQWSMMSSKRSDKLESKQTDERDINKKEENEAITLSDMEKNVGFLEKKV